MEIGNAQAFLDWTQSQPWIILHELAHGYHHLVLGYEHPGVRGAWEAKVQEETLMRYLISTAEPASTMH